MPSVSDAVTLDGKLFQTRVFDTTGQHQITISPPGTASQETSQEELNHFYLQEPDVCSKPTELPSSAVSCSFHGVLQLFDGL